MIRARSFLIFIAFLLLNLAFLGLHSYHERQVWLKEALVPIRNLSHHLALTDLALWTEARYTRHPALADFFAPFQDSPASFEHFPAGSIIAPRHPAVATTLQIHHNSSGSSR